MKQWVRLLMGFLKVKIISAPLRVIQYFSGFQTCFTVKPKYIYRDIQIQ